jgi:hypothetical protein
MACGQAVAFGRQLKSKHNQHEACDIVLLKLPLTLSLNDERSQQLRLGFSEHETLSK